MKPSLRAIKIASYTCIVMLVLGWITGSGLGFILMNAGMAIAMTIDYYLTKKQTQYEITRETENTWQQHQCEPMRFCLVNRGGFPLIFSGVEALEANRISGDFSTFIGTVVPQGTLNCAYKLTPLRRGDHRLGSIMIRYESKFKLWDKTDVWSLPYHLKVYPNLSGLKQFSLQRLQNRRQLEALRVLRLKSTGRAFDSLRDYVAGDDYRGINWMATARHGYPVVNTYQLENNQKIYLMMDCGRAQRYLIDGVRQIDASIETAVLLSQRIAESGDQFGMTAFDHRILTKLPCGRGRGWSKRLIESLYLLEPSLYQAHFGEAYLETMRNEHHRSIVMWFTDFDQKQEAERFLSQLSKGLRKHVHVVLMMARSDYQELAVAPFNEDAVYDKGVAIQLLEEREQIAAYLRAHGVFVSICSPRDLPTMALQNYLLAKARLQGD